MGRIPANLPSFAANDLSGYSSLVDGIPCTGFGGTVNVRNLTATSNPLYQFDVEKWTLVTSFGEQPIAMSGTLGATSSRRCGFSYAWEADLVLDLRYNLELPLRAGSNPMPTWQAEIYFCLGAAKWPAQFAAPVTKRYQWLPRAKISTVSPSILAGDKKQTRQHYTGTANCHALLLPDLGDPQNANTIAGAYAAFLRSNPNA